MGKNNQQRRRAKAKARARGGAAPRETTARGLTVADIVAQQAPVSEAEAGVWVDVLLGRSSALPPAQATARVEAALADARGSTLVARVLTARLVDAVAEAWRRGWRPSEIDRIAPRFRGELPARIVRDAMALEVGRHARATVSPVWLEELTRLDAHVWWGRDSDPVRARLSLGEHPAHEVVRAAVSAVLILRDGLPSLDVLDPPPGEWREATGRASRPGDAKLLDKVRQMLAKAESTPYEAEAEAFTAAAQKLMARHSIDAAMLAATARSPSEGPAMVRLGIDRPYEQQKVMLLGAVAQANRCRTIWAKDVSLVSVVGFPADLEAVDTLFTSLLLQATRAMSAAGTRKTAYGSRTRSFRSTFLGSYAQRIGERLQQEAHAAAAEVSDEMSSHAGPSTDLVRILAERTEEVDAAFAERFPHVVTKRFSAATDPEGWAAGRRAADAARLKAHDEVTAGGAGQ